MAMQIAESAIVQAEIEDELITDSRLADRLVVMAEGQIEGGSLQAVGWATIEEIKMKDGGYQNDRLATYLIPTALDAPRIRTILVENPYSRGPFGAKGIGELPMDGPAPAIIAAIHDATGVWLDEIPATPEKVLAACASR